MEWASAGESAGGGDTWALRSSEFRQGFGGWNVSSIDVAVIVVVFKPICGRTPSEIRESTKNAPIIPGLRVFVIPYFSGLPAWHRFVQHPSQSLCGLSRHRLACRVFVVHSLETGEVGRIATKSFLSVLHRVLDVLSLPEATNATSPGATMSLLLLLLLLLRLLRPMLTTTRGERMKKLM